MDQHWRVELSETQICTKDYLNENLWEQPMESKYFKNTFRLHFIKGSSECVLLEILSVQSSKKRKFRNGHVDRQVFTVFEALKRRLNGQLADVRTEWRTNTKSVSCRRGPKKFQKRELWGETVLDPNTPGKPRKVEYCTSEWPRKSLSIQRQLDNIDVYCRKWFDRSPEKETDKFPFSWGNEYHYLYLWRWEDNISGIIL